MVLGQLIADADMHACDRVPARVGFEPIDVGARPRPRWYYARHLRLVGMQLAHRRSRPKRNARVVQARLCRSRRPACAAALPAEGECIPKIAELGSNTPQELELEAFRNELQDRRRVVDRVVHESLFGIRRRDDGRNTRSGPPSIGSGRRHRIPKPAVLIMSYDDRQVLPLGATAKRLAIDTAPPLPELARRRPWCRAGSD